MTLADYKFLLLGKRKQYKRKYFLKIVVSALYIMILTLIGLSFNGTYSIFNTLARTPPSEAGTAEAKDILEVKGSFEAKKWLETGKSGFVVENVSQGNIWVYFSVEAIDQSETEPPKHSKKEKNSPLGEVLQHINPICIKPGESFEVPVSASNITPLEEEDQVNELGLLGWRNNERVFQGKLMARVLNNFAVYEVGTVTIKGSNLYDKLVKEADDPDGEITQIKNVNDLLALIAQKAALLKEREQLIKERDDLLEENKQLTSDKAQLEESLFNLEQYADSLSQSLNDAKKMIDEIKQIPTENSTDPKEEVAPDQGSNPTGTTETEQEPETPTIDSTSQPAEDQPSQPSGEIDPAAGTPSQ